MEAPIKKTPRAVNAGVVAIGKASFLMRFSFYLFVVLIVLAVPSGAQAVVLLNPDGTRAEPYSTWADRAKVPTSNARVEMSDPQECADFEYDIAGGTFVDDLASITMCINPFLPFDGLYSRRVFAHELGHVYLAAAMDDARRAAFRTIVHDHFGGWDMLGGVEETFADAYSWCAIGPPAPWLRHQRRSKAQAQSDYWPTRSEHRRVCRLIRQPN